MMKRPDLKFIYKAVSICKEEVPLIGQHRIVAIVTDGKNRILSVGTNSYTKTHPKQAEFARHDNVDKKFLHAEIAALVKIKDDQAKKIYIARLRRDGSFALARPCPICQIAIREAGISEIIYTIYDGIQREKVDLT